MVFMFEKTKLEGVVIIKPQVFGDNRGYFMETYKKESFAEAGIKNLRTVDRRGAERREQADVLCAGRICARVPGAERRGPVCVEVPGRV